MVKRKGFQRLHSVTIYMLKRCSTHPLVPANNIVLISSFSIFFLVLLNTHYARTLPSNYQKQRTKEKQGPLTKKSIHIVLHFQHSSPFSPLSLFLGSVFYGGSTHIHQNPFTSMPSEWPTII